ncbi:MAG: sigma 54 modulation/S30EA ribosomal C-terminal domain-containing protein [Lachnospiraceae bacterium]
MVKRKTFPAKPMDIEEAEMQMELLGHSFFVFFNSDTDEVNVLYKRKDGNLGLIEPEYE